MPCLKTLRPCGVLEDAVTETPRPTVFVLTLIMALLSFVGSSCTQSPVAHVAEQVDQLETAPWADPDVVIVEVDGKKITRGDYYHRVLEKFGARLLMAGIIKEELFLQEAARLGLQVSDDEVEADVEKRIALEAERAGGRENLEQIYRRDGLAVEDLKKDVAPQVRLEKLIVKVVQAKRVIDEATLRKRYKETFAETRYRLSHVAYNFARPNDPADVAERKKPDAVAKAVRATQEARSGVDFARIARAESDDQMTRDRGGDMGYVSIAELSNPQDAKLRQIVLELDEGEVSDPVEIEWTRSIHVFKLTEKVEHRSFGEVTGELRTELETRIPTREEIEAELVRLAQKADVRILGSPSGEFYKESIDPGASTRSPGAPARGVAPAETAVPSPEATRDGG